MIKNACHDKINLVEAAYKKFENGLENDVACFIRNIIWKQKNISLGFCFKRNKTDDL